MGSFDNVSVYERLGVRPSINAVGTGTVVGGSGPPKIVREKMEEASRSFADMGEFSLIMGRRFRSEGLWAPS